MLSTHYGEGLVVALIFNIINIAGVAFLTLPVIMAVLRGFIGFSWNWKKLEPHIHCHFPQNSAQLFDFTVNIAVAAILALAFLVLFSSLVAGLFAFHYKATVDGKGKISNLFSVMKESLFKGFRLLLLMEAKTVLWGLVGEIPGTVLMALSERIFDNNLYLAVSLNILGVLCFSAGIILAYRARFSHSMAFFSMCAEECGAWRAVHTSEKYMKGNILRLITLNLSLIPWYLLALLTCGLGFVFVQPYAMAVNTVFYCDISNKALEFEK